MTREGIVQAWEYRYVWANLTERAYRPQEVDGEELPDWREGPGLGQYLSRLGAEGWELVGFAAEGPPARGVSLHLVFKRPQP